MNMYSQYTPQPVGLPLLLPVPLVLPVNTDGSESTVKSTKESLHPENLQGELNIRPETETEQSEEGQKHGQMIKEEEGHKPSSLQDHASSCSSDLRTDFKPTFDNQEDFFDTSAGPVTHPPGRQTSPPVSDEDMPSSPLPHLPPLSPPSALETPQRSPVAPPPPILVPQTLDKDKNKDCNLEQLSKKDEQHTPETDFTQLVSSKQNTLKSECGVDAWKRWIKWRESQTNLEPVSSHALTLKADLLRCSVAELSDCLLCFIREVKQSDGEPYSLNRLFYLCLSIQLSSIAEAAQRSFLPPARSELPSQQPSVVLACPSQ